MSSKEQAHSDSEDELGTKAENKQEFPVVGIGASAGGLKALQAFFDHMPADNQMAFVVLQHLEPAHEREAALANLVGQHTDMPVQVVEDGMLIQPNHVYITPGSREIALLHGALHLIEPTIVHYKRLPIDYLFRSLASDQGEQAIGIVLSGTGTDGSLGIRAIKGEGGLTIAQSPESAEYEGMPESAIATDLVDYILAPEEMPQQLINYVEHDFYPGIPEQRETLPTLKEAMGKIFVILRSTLGHDFSQYKENTVLRRVQRRMVVNQIEDVNEYVRYIQQNQRETELLFKDLLIGVTSFFRDEEAFEALQAKVIPELFAFRETRDPIRVWVPGCATGEEAYTLAILLKEHMVQTGQEHEVQIFATDIDEGAVEQARTGIYPENIAADVSKERLDAFFLEHDGQYQIKSQIRDMLIFAAQNVTRDPPFSSLDLISCRNLLIYFGPKLQQKVIPLFHYALKSSGYLFLGTSETLGRYEEYFEIIDRKWKIFKHDGTKPAMRPAVGIPAPALAKRLPALRDHIPTRDENMQRMAEQMLLEELTPPSVLVNKAGQVLYFHSRTGKYLEPASGEPSFDIHRMTREGLRMALATALRRAAKENREVIYTNVIVQTNGHEQAINLVVRPITHPEALKGLFLIVFQDTERLESTEYKTDGETHDARDERIQELEMELQTTRQYLQTTIEELETSNEELKSTNEELQSANEELQSTNEELETAKEELQSVNEELVTVNQELENKIDELTEANNDMQNLLSSIQIGIIFLDLELAVKRFNPAAVDIVNLIDSDVGRPLSHISSNLECDGLVEDAREVLDTLVPRETMVQSTGGKQYQMRIRPYRTIRNAIDGVVLTFTPERQPGTE